MIIALLAIGFFSPFIVPLGAFNHFILHGLTSRSLDRALRFDLERWTCYRNFKRGIHANEKLFRYNAVRREN